MKTIAQQLNVKTFPFEINDLNHNQLYFEDSNGYWSKQEYDSNNNLIYCEDSKGYWSKREFNSYGNEIYWENSNGYWFKREYDSNNNVIYYENSNGDIIDDRPKTELTMDEIASKFGIDVNQLKIKK